MLKVVCGAPCCGKSKYINNRRKDGELVFSVHDFLHSVTGQWIGTTPSEARKLVRVVLDTFLTLAENDLDKNYWLECIYISDNLRSRIDTIVRDEHNIKASRNALLLQAETDEQRERINDYFDSSTSIREFYKTKTWRKKRLYILRRDKYLCQECLRYGRKIEAKEVHHITPLKEDYDRRLDVNNLISLCGDCHKKMHLKGSGELSLAGIGLKRRKLTSVNKK